jgi:hypothetical protein
MPSMSYKKTVEDFNIYANLELTIDRGAPDPKPGVTAANAESADREDWYTIFLEEKLDYPISHLFREVNFPGTLSVFLNQENYIYPYPNFPVSDQRPIEGKIAAGSLEIGPSYENEFKFGRLLGKLGFPLSYLNRFSDDIGFGMNFTAAYLDIAHLGIGFEFSTRTAFVPEARYSETEFLVTYTWMDFLAELDIIAEGAFESAIIKPEVQYGLKSLIFKVGVEISDIGKFAAFSPYMGFLWNY